MLGFVDDVSVCRTPVEVAPGDSVVLYTDGVLEAKNTAQEEFGSPRFLQFLEAQSHLSAAPLIRASLTELTRWSGKGEAAAREDDITLVAVDFERSFSGGPARSR